MPYKDLNKRVEHWRKYFHLNKSRHKEGRRDSYLKRLFGITLEEYNEFLTKQNYCCALCKRSASDFKKNLAVDHCHETGRVRGLLCMKCNIGLGLLGDNQEAIERVLEYVS